MAKTQASIQSKVALLRLAKELRSVSQACRIKGTSRDTFYRYAKLYAVGGSAALTERSRRKPVRKNRVAPEVEKSVVAVAVEQPAWGQARVADELRKRALVVSPAGVRAVWMRHDLQTMTQRLDALRAKIAQDGIVLTESQQSVLAKTHHEFESAWPGHCGAQDTYYVGALEGVGRIYQQTFIDSYSKVAFANLYGMRGASTATDLLKERVVPFFQEHRIRLCRVLTDHGTEYCGNLEDHEYERYLTTQGIDHTRSHATRPRTRGICARFHRTLRDELYRVAFRTRRYSSIEDLQRDLGRWLHAHNHDRSHEGRWCYGKTPMQTFLDSLALARQRMIAA